MFTDFYFAWRDSPFGVLVTIVLSGGAFSLLPVAAFVGVRRLLRLPVNTLGVKLSCAAGALAIGVSAAVFFAGFSGTPKRAVLLDGPEGRRVAIFHEGHSKRGTDHLIRGRSLADGAVLYQTPRSSGPFRVVQLGPRFVWLDESDGPEAIDLYNGQVGAKVAQVVASASASKKSEFKITRQGDENAEAFEVMLQDGAPAFITPAGALSRAEPQPSDSKVVRLGVEAKPAPFKVLALHRAEVLPERCGCVDASSCGALIRFNTTAFGSGERRVTLFDGTQKWTRAWAELAGSEDAELLAAADAEGSCLWITSHERGEAVWFQRATGEVQRRVALR